MKPLVAFIGLLFLTLGCNNSTQENSDIGYSDSSASNKLPTQGVKPENSLVYVPTYALWAFKYDTVLSDFKLIKMRLFNKDTLTAQSIETIINKTWPKVQVKYLKTSKDTIFLVIPESEVLTQQMGTTGAEHFMISATYSFTEFVGIKYVSYQFEYGDHANPGVYSRNSWDRQ